MYSATACQRSCVQGLPTTQAVHEMSGYEPAGGKLGVTQLKWVVPSEADAQRAMEELLASLLKRRFRLKNVQN